MFQVAVTILLTLTFVEQTEGALQSQQFGDVSLLSQPNVAEDSYYTSGQAITNIAVWVYTGEPTYILPISGIQITYGKTVASLHGSMVYGSTQLSSFQFQVPAGDVITQVDVGLGYPGSPTGSNNYICYLQFHTKSTDSEIMSSTGCSMTTTASLSHGLAYIGYGVHTYTNSKVSSALGIGALQFFYDDGLSTPTTAIATTSASAPQGSSTVSTSTTTSSPSASSTQSTDSPDYAKWIGIGATLLAVVVSVIAIVARYKMSKKKSSKTPVTKAAASKAKQKGTNNKEAEPTDQQSVLKTSESTVKLVDEMDLDDIENPRVAARKVSMAKQPITLLKATPILVKPEQVVIQQQAPPTTAILVESAPPRPSIIQQAPPPAHLPTQYLVPNGPVVFSANMQPAQRVTLTSQPMTVRPQYHVTTTYPTAAAAAGPTLVQYPAPSSVTMVKNVTPGPGLMTYHNFHS